MTEGVVFRGPLRLQQRFGFPVTSLLFPISSQRWPAIMPDHCAGVETNLQTTFQQAPTNVHVVARSSEPRVKASYSSELILAKRGIASRNMLGITVREHHVQWT